MTLQDEFGNIDIYLFDQLLRDRLRVGMRVLDAGCGGGRNLVYLLRHRFDVWAIDADPDAVASVRHLFTTLAPSLRGDRVRLEPVERCSFDDRSFDMVISNAVLHFAESDAQFEAMVGEMWRVLVPGGVFFCRLASSIGLSGAQPLGDNRFLLPDGSERYLVSAERLLMLTERLGGVLLDPLKTTLVHEQRSMTTWVVGKRPAGEAI